MEAGTEVGRARLSADELDPETRKRVEREVEDELEQVDRATAGESLNTAEQRGALSYLLGARAALTYDVPVKYETEDGTAKLTFVILQQDGRKIDATETRNRDKTTGVLDQITCDCQIVAESLAKLTDATGAEADVRSEAFRTVKEGNPPLASPADALEARFREQLGVISGVAREVRRVSGWAPERVGEAEQRLVKAAGNS